MLHVLGPKLLLDNPCKFFVLFVDDSLRDLKILILLIGCVAIANLTQTRNKPNKRADVPPTNCIMPLSKTALSHHLLIDFTKTARGIQKRRSNSCSPYTDSSPLKYCRMSLLCAPWKLCLLFGCFTLAYCYFVVDAHAQFAQTSINKAQMPHDFPLQRGIRFFLLHVHDFPVFRHFSGLCV